MNKLVSIIVPVHNRATLVKETLDSIRGQTYEPIEVLIVDDGSTDDTKQVVRRWIEKSGHPKANLFSLEQNVGKSSAVNYALERYRGDYVMVFDSDDILLPDAIAFEVEFLESRPHVGMVAARSYIMKGDVRTSETFDLFKDYGSFDNLEEVYGDMLIKGNAIISSTVLLRREVINAVGLLTEDLRYVHDWEYWVRVAKQFSIGFLAKPVMYYRMNVAGASSMNRFGTFRETCTLLLRARSEYPLITMIKAMLYQTKYNAWLAYHDPRYGEMLKIFLFGAASILKLAIGAKG